MRGAVKNEKGTNLYRGVHLGTGTIDPGDPRDRIDCDTKFNDDPRTGARRHSPDTALRSRFAGHHRSGNRIFNLYELVV